MCTVCRLDLKILSKDDLPAQELVELCAQMRKKRRTEEDEDKDEDEDEDDLAVEDEDEELTADGWQVTRSVDATEPRLEDFGDGAGGPDNDVAAVGAAVGAAAGSGGQ